MLGSGNQTKSRADQPHSLAAVHYCRHHSLSIHTSGRLADFAITIELQCGTPDYSGYNSHDQVAAIHEPGQVGGLPWHS